MISAPAASSVVAFSLWEDSQTALSITHTTHIPVLERTKPGVRPALASHRPNLHIIEA